MTVVVHTVPGSPFARAVLLTCEEKGVSWRIAPLAPGEHKQAAHLARHPFGRIPAVEIDGFALYEVQAIVRYVDAAFPGPRLTPADPKAMARMSQVMNIVDWYVMPSLTSGIGFNRLVAPVFGIPADEAAVAAAIPLGRTCIAALEDLLGSQPYFAGDEVTLADLVAVSHLDMVPASPEGAELIAGSTLLPWLDRMNARPSVQKTAMQKIMAEHRPAAAA